MQRMTLGDFELTAISDGIYHLDGGGMFGVVPRSLVGAQSEAGGQQSRAPGI